MRPRSSWTQEPSKFNSEERREWKQWLDDPKSTSFERDAGSRARPVSFATRQKRRKSEVDELYEQMVKRGVVARGLELPHLCCLPVGKGELCGLLLGHSGQCARDQ